MTDSSPPTILQRILEFGRIETDLPEDEIQRIIDAENKEVVRRYGPHANPLLPITVTVPGGYPTITLPRPIDAAHPIVVVESWRSTFTETVTDTTLDATDYKLWDDGRTIERLWTGTTPLSLWGWDGSAAGWVTVTYTPQNDGDQREEVIIRLVQLAIEYSAVSKVRLGNVEFAPVDYYEERERLLKSLAPRGVLFR